MSHPQRTGWAQGSHWVTPWHQSLPSPSSHQPPWCLMLRYSELQEWLPWPLGVHRRLQMVELFSPRSSICVRPLVMLPLVHSSEAREEKRYAAVGSFTTSAGRNQRTPPRQKREGRFRNVIRRLLVLPTICCQVPSRPQAAGWVMVGPRDRRNTHFLCESPQSWSFRN